MNTPTDPREAEARALAQALREQAQQEQTPDVSEALQKRISTETRDGGAWYVLVQVLLVGVLVAAGVAYIWH